LAFLLRIERKGAAKAKLIEHGARENNSFKDDVTSQRYDDVILHAYIIVFLLCDTLIRTL
jgi:hypothetical protein